MTNYLELAKTALESVQTDFADSESDAKSSVASDKFVSDAKSPVASDPYEIDAAYPTLGRTGTLAFARNGPDSPALIGIWSDLDSAEIRGALKTLGWHKLAIRYLDGP